MKNMSKHLLFLFIAFNTLILQAQEIKIVVAIAQKKTDCISTDLGYQVFKGKMDSYNLTKDAQVKVKKDFPESYFVDTKDNIDWGKYMGSYMIIISGSTNDDKGCRRVTYGAGFGQTHEDALKDAVNHLDGRNWSWTQNKGYTIVEDRKINPNQ